MEKPTRDTAPVRLAVWVISSWCCVLSASVALLGPKVTSAQWVYLLSLPGGRWSWFALFGICGVSAAFGQLRTMRKLVTAGLIIPAFACLGIAVFYLISPLINDGLTTLGYLPWFLCSLLMFYIGAITQSSRTW